LPPPEAAFAIILRGVFDDVLLITAVLALAWHVNGQQSSDIGARAAALLLRRQVIEGEGSRFAPGDMRSPAVFRSLFSLLLRAAAPDADAAAARGRLQGIFVDAIAAIQEQRTRRLRALPIDWGKWNALTEAMSNALDPELYCFQDFRVERIREQASTSVEWRLNNIDKANFVTPSMSWESTGDLNRLIVEMFRKHLTSYVWWSFSQRPRESLQIDDPDDSFWNAVAQNSQRVEPSATLLTDYDPIGANVSHWIYSPVDERPAGRGIAYMQGHPSGGGTGYVGTIDGVKVFTTDVEESHSYLFSALMLEAVSYRLVTPDAFVSVEFEEGDNPWTGTVVVRFAQHVAWHETPVIELVTADTMADEQTPTAA
jgi:hypothetical protein